MTFLQAVKNTDQIESIYDHKTIILLTIKKYLEAK